MKTGDIVIVPFPFADAPVRNVRPGVVNIDRIATLRRNTIITTLGRLSSSELMRFKTSFRKLVG